MARRRKRHDDSHVDETWLIPYADMLTLLLALFIVLFAASTVDKVKLGQISQTFSAIFSGDKHILYEKSIDVDTTTPVEVVDNTDPGEKDYISKAEEDDIEKLAQLEAEMQLYFEARGLHDAVETKLSDEGLLITFTDNLLFESGSAEVTVDAKLLVIEVSEFLVTDPPRDIRLSGHTDNRPISTEQFPSNWELSSARAINMMKIILKNTLLDPRRFSATGYGEYRPIAANDTATGRAKNRRVEILILPYNHGKR